MQTMQNMRLIWNLPAGWTYYHSDVSATADFLEHLARQLP